MFKTITIAVLTTLLISAAPVTAATITSTNTCALSQVTGGGSNSSNCFGKNLSGPGQVQDIAINKNNKAKANQDFFDDELIGVAGVGMFGHTDWQELGKAEDDLAGGTKVTGTIGLTVTNNANGAPWAGDTEGKWSVNANAFATFGRIFIVVKSTDAFATYLFDGKSLPTGGTWNTHAFPGNNNNFHGISHFTVFAGGTPISTIPLPAGGLLLLTALGGIGLMRRKRA